MIDYKKLEEEEKPFADRLAWWIATVLRPETILDIGCGPGLYTHSLRSFGLDATGIDNDERIDKSPYLHRESLLTTKRSASLVICLEVAEHIDHILEKMVARAVVNATVDTLIWSAAQPGQGGVGHINCQPRNFWANLISSMGLFRDYETERDLLTHIMRGYHMGWFANNMMVFRRRLELGPQVAYLGIPQQEAEKE